MTPLARVFQKIVEGEPGEERAADPEDVLIVGKAFDQWRQTVARELDRARRELIQIRSDKHPKGLIEATWRNITNATHLDAMMSRVRRRVVESRGSYDLFSDIHSLCWDLIERDLAQLRLHMLQGFYKPLAEQLNGCFNGLSWDQRTLASPYFREAHAALEGRVLEVCGWFIRPVFRRDQYDLRTLVGSTLSIVRDLDAAYEFTEDVAIDESININRGSFEVFGDILFVLIGNAAKHGKRGGRVRVAATRHGLGGKYVALEVESELASLEEYAAAARRIREAYDVAERYILEIAAVGEGFTGIRKILGLIRRVRSPQASFSVALDEASLSTTFKVLLPAEITFKRERA